MYMSIMIKAVDYLFIDICKTNKHTQIQVTYRGSELWSTVLATEQ